LPASIFEMSRMSLITASSAAPLLRAVVTYSRWSGERGVSARRLIIPRTAFRGVRISWLMLARNSLLEWLASSAWSRCRRRSRLWWTMATLIAVARPRITRRMIWLSQRNVPYVGLERGRPRASLRATVQRTRAPYSSIAESPATTHVRASCRRQVNARARK
jgi:hypothetical protein